jgi:hypothetical protein
MKNLTLTIKNYQKEGRIEEIHILIEDTGEIITIGWDLDTIDYQQFHNVLNVLGMQYVLHIVNEYYIYDDIMTNTYLKVNFN